MYHDIVGNSDIMSGFQNDSAFQYKVDDILFEAQVAALKDKDVTFTFDDGGVSFITKAAPILEKYKMHGVFFISTKYLETPGFLDKKQVRELHDRGHIIASHTHTHPLNISVLPEKEIIEEWRVSKVLLEEITGVELNMASIPNGYLSKKIIVAASKAGITNLFTSEPTINKRQSFGVELVGRYVIHRNMSVLDVNKIATNRCVQAEKYILWKSLNILKMFLGKYYEPVKRLIVK